MALHPANPELVLAELDRRMAGYGNGKKTAAELDMDETHLRSVKCGSQGITMRLAERLGFELRWVRRRGGEAEKGEQARRESGDQDGDQGHG